MRATHALCRVLHCPSMHPRRMRVCQSTAHVPCMHTSSIARVLMQQLDVLNKG